MFMTISIQRLFMFPFTTISNKETFLQDSEVGVSELLVYSLIADESNLDIFMCRFSNNGLELFQ